MLDAPRELVHNEAFNVGANAENYRIRELAEIVAEVVPGARATFAEGGGPDKRSYRVDCSKIARVLPGFQPQWTVRRGVEELDEAYARQRPDLRAVHRPQLPAHQARAASFRRPVGSTTSCAGALPVGGGLTPRIGHDLHGQPSCGTRRSSTSSGMRDERGFLARTFCEREFAEHGLAMRDRAEQHDLQPARAHTLRGLHFQEAPHAETKLVRCTRGSDLRRHGRPAARLDRRWRRVARRRADRPQTERLVYVPEGFAQGYQTLEDDTEVLYQMSHHYVPEAARGVRWDDPAFGIDWPAAERAAHLRPRSGVAGLLARGYAVVSRPACSSRSAARRTTG